jgi:ABC-2 type transport system permease protein
MSTYRMFALARRVVLQLAADRRTIALILIVPLIALTVVGILVRSETSGLAIGVILEDEGAPLPLGSGTVNLGERLADSLNDAMPGTTVQTLDHAQADAALAAGSLDAVITLGPDFSRQTIASRALELPVEFEGSNPMAARLLEGLVMRAAIQSIASISPIAAQSMPSVTLQAVYRHGGPDFDSLDYLAPVFIGLFVFLFVFILTSVAFLRERTAGTLERLQASPIRRHEIIAGYMFGFALFALAQSLIILGFTILGLRVNYAGSLLVVFVVEALLAMMAVNLGIFFSTFARNEFQVVQFIPLVLVTQIALSGALWPIKDMPAWLQPVAWLMPLTHANYALRDVMIKGADLIAIWPYVLALIGFAVAFVVLAAQTIQRQAWR